MRGPPEFHHATCLPQVSLAPEALATVVERVLGEDSFAAALGRRARDLVVREYDLGVLVAREIRILKQLAK